jgi:CelD/BcsL family acetyltransferase involved in cellulose biosynthesis
LEALLAYHRERWPSGSPRFYEFMRGAVERLTALGRGQFCVLRADSEILAVFFLTRYRDILGFYLQGLRPLPGVSLGIALMGLSLERTIADGVRCADFLRGVEDYKFVWAREVSGSIEITIAQRRPRAIARVLADHARELLGP